MTRFMTHTDPTGARKCTTWKTKWTRDEYAFLYDFNLPSVTLSSAKDPKLPPDPVESHKSGTPLGVAQALTPQQSLSWDPADHVYFVHPSTDILVDISTDTWPMSRSTYRLSIGWYVDRDVSDICRSNIGWYADRHSTNILTDMLTESDCAIVGQHVDR